MPEHSPKNTEARSAWCNTCGRLTMHYVFDGRIGRCKEHEAAAASKKQIANRAKLEKEKKNPRLF
jgi:hypothetical protein